MISGAYPAFAESEVVVLDKLTYAGNIDNLSGVADHPGFTFVQGDIRDEAVVRRAMSGADTVFHFAAESHVDRSIDSGLDFVETNVTGTYTLLDAALALGVRRFVHVSTDEVYGSVPEGSSAEDDQLLPNSPYSASKASAELLCRSFFVTHGLDVSVSRAANTYGPYQFPEKLIPLSVTNLMDGGDVTLYGDGRNIRNWIHVDDHCAGVALVGEKGRAGEAYNIGGVDELGNHEIVDLLLSLTGHDRSRVRYVEDRKGHDRRYSLDCTRVTEELGHRPRVRFEDGLADTVRWYSENRGWWEPMKKRVPSRWH
ncbi:dTDP-glucose 4,6-dehydratase [Nocardiopsis terrae]|uniref:dTDP-glucose 4,6-dehydratase n=2 Tax=Nocardiopsis terrae TaxID=372655 RepID=A0ABR9HAY7_9ACTN|nr:dTDP-glucose 4,6-dehydratase [Nocardiopsis terrae]GHC96518.1 dTDP-glucose 4,6-dehydratase [Nocardiopsis terrae]